MKKALSLAMAALLALSLTACGNSGSTAPAESSTPAQETAAPAESVEASTEAFYLRKHLPVKLHPIPQMPAMRH